MKVIIDVDTGSDDALAIMMALSHPEMDVIAVTCVHGNIDVDQVCLNTLRVLQVCGRLDIPVFRGAETSLVARPRKSSAYYHGRDGLGDSPDPHAPPRTAVQDEHAVTALSRLTKQHPGEITLVTLAPLTNIALALRLDPGIGKQLRNLVIMGGNMHAVGNIQPCHEYNFHCDPEAAHVVLAEMSCPIRLVPLEPTVTHGAPENEFYDREIMPLTTPKALFHHRTVRVADTNRRSSIGRCASCDANAMATVVDPAVVTKATHVFCTVELDGTHTRSQLIIDWKNHLEKPANVELVQEFDLSRLQQMIKNTLL